MGRPETKHKPVGLITYDIQTLYTLRAITHRDTIKYYLSVGVYTIRAVLVLVLLVFICILLCLVHSVNTYPLKERYALQYVYVYYTSRDEYSRTRIKYSVYLCIPGRERRPVIVYTFPYCTLHTRLSSTKKRKLLNVGNDYTIRSTVITHVI